VQTPPKQVAGPQQPKSSSQLPPIKAQQAAPAEPNPFQAQVSQGSH
jgi:hypothetical protein